MAEAPCASGATAQLAASPHDAVRWKITCMYRQLERVPSMLERLTSLGQGQLSAEVQEWVVGALMRDPYHASHVIDVDYHRCVHSSNGMEAVSGATQKGELSLRPCHICFTI